MLWWPEEYPIELLWQDHDAQTLARSTVQTQLRNPGPIRSQPENNSFEDSKPICPKTWFSSNPASLTHHSFTKYHFMQEQNAESKIVSNPNYPTQNDSDSQLPVAKKRCPQGARSRTFQQHWTPIMCARSMPSNHLIEEDLALFAQECVQLTSASKPRQLYMVPDVLKLYKLNLVPLACPRRAAS